MEIAQTVFGIIGFVITVMVIGEIVVKFIGNLKNRSNE
jgi:hypothetical protein